MFEPVFTIIIVAVLIIALIFELYDPVIVFFSAVALFVLTGILDIQEAAAGFTNPGLITIAALFIIVGVIKKSNTVLSFATGLFGKAKQGSTSPLRVMLPVTLFSAFINNIPVTALFISIVRNWSLKNNISPSKYLLPLSYAAIFGGLLTMIGTSTNLLVNGLLLDFDQPGLWMFEITAVGLPLAIAGTVYMVTIGHRLLPDNEDLLKSFGQKQKDYLVQAIVESNSDLAGKTVKNAGLRNLKGLYLIEIVRNGQVISPVRPDEYIKEEDKLIFTGQVATIGQLIRSKPGLKLETSSDTVLNHYKTKQAQLVEAVVSESFPSVDKTIKESQFRSRYDAAVVAVIRNGERIKEKIGSIRLKAGDTLLLLTGNNFTSIWGGAKDFYLVSAVEEEDAHDGKGKFALAVFAAMLILATMHVLPLVTAAFFAVAVLLLTRCVNLKEANRAINWNVILIIGFALGVSRALVGSGAADLLL
jgi:di/tricarboxylate transporter